MNENKKPSDAISKVIASELTSKLRQLDNNLDNKVRTPDLDEVTRLSEFELRTLEDDPAFTELLVSLREETERSRKSSSRTFIVALLSLVVGTASLVWGIVIHFIA